MLLKDVSWNLLFVESLEIAKGTVQVKILHLEMKSRSFEQSKFQSVDVLNSCRSFKKLNSWVSMFRTVEQPNSWSFELSKFRTDSQI